MSPNTLCRIVTCPKLWPLGLPVYWYGIENLKSVWHSYFETRRLGLSFSVQNLWLLIPEILTATLLLIYVVALDIDVEFFSLSTIFAHWLTLRSSLTSEKWKLTTWKLKFRTDLWNHSMDCWSVTQWMIIFKGRFLKTSLIQACPVNASLYMVFKTHISFWADLAMNCQAVFPNFGCYPFRVMPKVLFKLFYTAIWSCCSVWLESEQTPFSLKCQFRSAAFNALHRTCGIQSKTWGFIPIPYFYPETDEWSKDWAN